MAVPRFANGRPVSEEELDAIARAFGFRSAKEMEQAMQHADAARAQRKKRSARV
jgi:hypothetical protein